MPMGLGMGMGLSRAVAAASGPAAPLWSAATTGAIADPAAWSVTGTGIAISGGAMVLTNAVSTDTMTLTGAYATALNAAVPSSTLLNIQVDITAWTAGGSVRMRLKGSGVNTYGSISGNGTQSFQVTSGAASGVAIFGLTGTPYSYTITDIRIYA